ncbi:MAG: beta-N-acetylhexosaminidase [Microthrixaceae bacterium]
MTTANSTTTSPAEPTDDRFEVLVPRPRLVAPSGGSLKVSGGEPDAQAAVRVEADPAVEDADLLKELVPQLLGMTDAAAQPDSEAGALPIRLGIDKTTEGPEGYELSIDTDGVAITGSDADGVFWGVQTLRQLLPATAGGASKPVELPTGVVTDAPRFEWRGVMLDVSRHFFGIEEVFRFIDAMALYKMNRLHLHLSDDQGWRLAIDGYPELTEVGGATQVGDGPGGFYSQDDYGRIVSYAAARHVMVVPEIDMPGHTNAALSSRPELNCDGQATEPYRGMNVGFSSLCIGTPETDRFVDTVLTQLAELTPGPYLHIGGDEAQSTEPADYRAFIERVDAKVRELGKTTMGWEDIAAAEVDPSTVAQVWRDEHTDRIAAQGLPIVASPAAHAYLDMKYDEDMDIGLAWAGVIDTKRAYDWDPTQLGGDTVLGAVAEGAEPQDATPEEGILGVEGPLWTETIEEFDELTTMAFPRAAALAEIGWTARDQRSWDGFRSRFSGHPDRLAAMGLATYDDPVLSD